MTTRRIERAPTLPEQLARRASELLADGKWHGLEKIINELSRLVPPGVAVRRVEQSRRNTQRGRAPAKRVQPITPEAAVRSGARAASRQTLRSSNAFELDMVKQRVRLVGMHKVVYSDQIRAQYLLPALERLAAHFQHTKAGEAFEQVQLVAHDAGLHLAQCPAGCRLGGPLPDDQAVMP